MENISIKDLWQLSPEERLVYLKTKWDLVDDCVYGQIEEKMTASGSKLYTLKNVKNINGKILEYPFDTGDIKKISKKVNDFGIFAGFVCKIQHSCMVKAHIIISEQSECLKANNPLSVAIQSLAIISIIPSSFVIKDEEGNLLIEESLSQFLLKTKLPKIDDTINKYEDELLSVRTKLSKKNEELSKVNDQISEIDDKRQVIKESLQNEKNELHKIKNECKRDKQKEISRFNKIKEETVKRMEQLKDYVQSKADFLHDLKLISPEQYNYVTGKTVKKLDVEEKYLDFEKDLNGDLDQLISQIQSYLYSQDKYYPKSILEIFLTLLRTNDLIIISGSSGSGKSFLVKAFAQAIGGVAKIIPVKPNWTSSEDLLGYYNPMQKSYMTTPFLDAIVAAKRDPEHLHLICLDEMNLARVEYYFADFLSVLEEREKIPTINLYSNEEAEHIKSEFRTMIDIFEESRSDFPDKRFANFGDFLHHKEITQKLHEILGKQENNSLIDLYGRARRMVSGILTIPAEFEFPSNVRIIGTINIDQTTHYFAPKVLDRAYLLKFESPLANVALVEEEVAGMDKDPSPVYLPPNDFWPKREPYPRYDSSNYIASKISEWNKEFLSPLGIEIGMRVMRQALLFQELYGRIRSDRTEQLIDSDTLNIIILLKILPHFIFDGDMNGSKDNNEIKKHDLVQQLAGEINATINPTTENNNSTNASTELQRMIQRAEHNDNVYNFWT
jgi:CII-binding regulator of phage lambda lysogenization HflD